MSERTGFDGAALGSKIKLLRALRRMSLDEVGQAAGLTKSHVWELEQGRSRNPTVNAVWGLARALSVSPAAILGLDDAMPPIHPLALQIAGMVDQALRATPSEGSQHLSNDGEASKPEGHGRPNTESPNIDARGDSR
jgi:transcriptional regulator with XRE-family HTH domain